MNLKEQRQLLCKPACWKDTKAVRFPSSRSAWDTARLGPAMVEMVISGLGRGSHPASLLSVPHRGGQISE